MISHDMQASKSLREYAQPSFCRMGQNAICFRVNPRLSEGLMIKVGSPGAIRTLGWIME